MVREVKIVNRFFYQDRLDRVFTEIAVAEDGTFLESVSFHPGDRLVVVQQIVLEE